MIVRIKNWEFGIKNSCVAFLILNSAFLIAGCGKKGPPLPPLRLPVIEPPLANLPDGLFDLVYGLGHASLGSFIAKDGTLLTLCMRPPIFMGCEGELCLQLCDGNRSVEAIAAELAQAYSAPQERILSDIITLLQELADKGIITA